MPRSCGSGGIMSTCHKEATSQHGIHISNLTHPGSPGGIACDAPAPPLSVRSTVPTPLVHIIAEISAVTRGPWVTRFGCTASPAEGWDCLLLSGLPVELLT